MEDWNELRLVLAVARAGSLTQAAKALGLDHSTVFRRLRALEERIGVRQCGAGRNRKTCGDRETGRSNL